MGKSLAGKTKGGKEKPRTCRDCGGYGAFHWGTQKVGVCGSCRGTGVKS